MRVCLLTLSLLLVTSITLAQVEEPQSDAEPLAALELLPKLDSPRDEAADDRVAATALFAHARMLQQRRDFTGALRRYERAFRYDEQQRGLNEIVKLATNAGRFDQASRYAAISPQKAGDGIMLRRLAVEATNRRDWKIAARIYQGLVQPNDSPGAKSAPQILMQAELGRLHFLSGDYESASKAFAQVRLALEKPAEYDLSEALQKLILGERRDTFALMARCALEAKQYDDALALFAEAHQADPESNQALRDKALVLERRGEFAEAEKLLLQVLSKGDADAVEPLRRVLTSTVGAEHSAAVLTEKLTPIQAAHPDNEAVRRRLARCYLDQNLASQAQTLLEAVADPADDTLVMLAETYRHAAVAEKWLAALSTVVTRNSLEAVEAEAEQAAQSEALTKSILEYASAAPAESAKDQSALQIAALVALGSKHFDQAEKLHESALSKELPAKGKQLLAWGRRLMQADEYERSCSVFQRVTSEKLVTDDLAAAHYYLSSAATLANKYDMALEAAREAVKLREGDIRFAIREAWVLQQAKRYAEAREIYDAAIKRFDRQTEPAIRQELRQARLVMSAICLELDDLAAAVERLEQVLDEYPEDIGAMNDLGYVWADRGLRLQRSLRMVQRAVAAEPENLAYRDSLGWVYFRLGRFAEAVVELEKAAAKSPGGLILDHLGDALAAAGRAEDSRSAWQKAAAAYRQEGNEGSALAAEKKISG